MKQLCKEEQVCCLTLDEMSISPCVEYDPSSGQLLGNVSLEGHSGVATHALVIMLGGVTSRWKQTVAYYFTGNSSDGTVLKPIILEIIEKAASIGLYVIAVTSDMGSMNRALWRSFGLRTGRHCGTVNKIPHPLDSQKSLHFLSDVPHVIKNLKAALVNRNVFTLPESIVSEHNLSSCNVSIAPVKDLAEFQELQPLKLAPKLSSSTLAPSHFEKMKVSNALNFFSNAVASGLHYLAKEEGRSTDYVSTAWFIAICNHWFDLMCSRHPVLALSKLHPSKHREAVNFLRSVVTLFKSLKIKGREN